MGQQVDHVIVFVAVLLTKVVLGGKGKGDKEVDGRFFLEHVAGLGLGDADPDATSQVTDAECHL